MAFCWSRCSFNIMDSIWEGGGRQVSKKIERDTLFQRSPPADLRGKEKCEHSEQRFKVILGQQDSSLVGGGYVI